jgi:hypothetical protein
MPTFSYTNPALAFISVVKTALASFRQSRVRDCVLLNAFDKRQVEIVRRFFKALFANAIVD